MNEENKELIFVITTLSSLACVIAAMVLAMNDVPGWGWFLFVGLLMVGSNNQQSPPS
jgi:hypothetical protein